jgi:NADH:ubiquinone oxidoreductase subunit K
VFERLMILSAVLFCIGLYGTLSRRHIIAVLISIEIMFNAVNIALVAISRYLAPAALRATGEVTESGARSLLAGQSFALFVIVVAAAEVALGLALVIAMVRRRDTVNIAEVSLMRR